VLGGGTFGLARFLDNGATDPAFNPPFPLGQTILGVALQPDGKVLVRGDVTNAAGASLPGLLRLNSDGSLDGTFSLGPQIYPRGRPLVLQPDGKILAGGVSFGPDEHVGPFRLHANGSLDLQFHAGWFGFSAPLSALVLNAEGYSYFGTENFQPEFGGANPDGTRNLLFNPEPGIGPWAALALAFDGKIMVGQYSDGSSFTPLRRLLPNGNDDPDWTPPQLGGGDSVVTSLLVQPDGKVLAGGNNLQSFNGVPNPSLGRLNPDGSLDTTFDAGAEFHYYAPQAMALAADGKFVVAGYNQSRTDFSTPQPGIWRLHNDAGPRGIEFITANYVVQEGDRLANIVVRRTGSATPATVRYDVEPGTATHGRDYTGNGGTLNFLPGETERSFVLRIKNDRQTENFETVYLRLVSAIGGTIGPRSRATLTIVDP
jgi:uncharacterized delta-60 repeat protein